MSAGTTTSVERRSREHTRNEAKRRQFTDSGWSDEVCRSREAALTQERRAASLLAKPVVTQGVERRSPDTRGAQRRLLM